MPLEEPIPQLELRPHIISVESASPDWTTHCPVFLGQRCTIDIDECVSKPCMNHGLCHNTQGSYMCECPPGFSGMDCEEDIDDCLASEYASRLLSPGAQESTRGGTEELAGATASQG